MVELLRVQHHHLHIGLKASVSVSGHEGSSRGPGTVTLMWDKISHSYQGLSLEQPGPGKNASLPTHYLSLPAGLSKVLSSSAQPVASRLSLSSPSF